MYVSLNWLREFVEIPSKYSPQDIADLLTLHTAEVEEVMDQGKGLEGVVVGEILEIKKHPNADKLSVAKVDIGKGKTIQLIFGQMAEMKVGYKTAVAVAPTILPTGAEIKATKIRDVLTEGMLCLDQELGLKKEGVSVQYFDKSVKNGTPFAKALDLDDIMIEIDNKSLTHRPDLWGHYGIARELAALLGTKLKPLNPPKPKEGNKDLSIEIKNKDLCPRFVGAKITGVKIEESPEWLQKKLRAAGHATYNNIVDITNYIVSELGQPMHAYDSRFITRGFVIRTAKKDEKFTTLDGTTHKLTDKNLLIADQEKGVSLAGIMGGKNSEIQHDTTEIIFEAANFDAVSIRKTSVQLGLRTESVQRFEKSLDPTLPMQAMLRAIELTLEICPDAKLSSPIVDIDYSKPKTPTIKVDPEKVRSKIGVNIKDTEIKKILENLEFKVAKKGSSLEVKVPTFRATRDVEIEDDLIEEVARIYGYENIPSDFPSLPPKLPTENLERFLKHKTRDIISLGLGFTEVSNYSFYSEADISKSNLAADEHIKLANYLSEDQTHLRTSLLPNMLKSLSETLKNTDNPKTYEIGRTYKEEGKYMPLEEKNILGLATGEKAFFHAKGSAELFLEKFGAHNPKIVPPRQTEKYAHPQKCADILAKGQKIGSIYEVHPQVLKNYGIKQEVAAFEINFTKLVELGQREHKYLSLPKFPSLQFDVSVVFPEKITAEQAEQAITQANKNLIKGIELFDIYRGKGLEEDEKALAYHIMLQAEDRTLTDEEMTETQKAVFKNLEGLGGKIRGK